jgi:hypothetical protein
MSPMLTKSKNYSLLLVTCLIGLILLLRISSCQQKAQNTQGDLGERIAMLESNDGGATWTFMGHAGFHNPDIRTVDPSAIWDKDLLVLYFLDLNTLGLDKALLYRTVATDDTGLDFIPPEVILEYAGDFTDPDVVTLPGGVYRFYLNSLTETAGIVSATSLDGFSLTLDPGIRTSAGGVPGVLRLPDGRVRLFVCGQGITSLISTDGLDFTPELGVRIPIPAGSYVVADPDPILTADGRYLMAYKVRPEETEEPTSDLVYLAESTDGLNWTPGVDPLAVGSVPTLVELPGGRLRIYYVDFASGE